MKSYVDEVSSHLVLYEFFWCYAYSALISEYNLFILQLISSYSERKGELFLEKYQKFFGVGFLLFFGLGKFPIVILKKYFWSFLSCELGSSIPQNIRLFFSEKYKGFFRLHFFRFSGLGGWKVSQLGFKNRSKVRKFVLLWSLLLISSTKS